MKDEWEFTFIQENPAKEKKESNIFGLLRHPKVTSLTSLISTWCQKYATGREGWRGIILNASVISALPIQVPFPAVFINWIAWSIMA